ncbi:hypothetical protein OB920_06830 [Halobacteria archaeon HArc-gm2]|nr:hypothetical protein [Halobacteria archaeon HArc-gm2]
MAQSGPVLGFSLRDTLTRLIPGMLLIAPFIVGVTIFVPSILPNGPIQYVLLGISAYLIGEFIDQLRAGLFRVPMGFRYFVYQETDQMDKLPRWYIYLVEVREMLPNKLNFQEERDDEERLTNSLEMEFRKDIESEVGVDFLDNRPREIYDLLLIYMDDHLTPRLRRLQSVSIFSTNLRIAAGGTLIIYTPLALNNWKDPFFWTMWGVSIIIAIVVVVFWSFLTFTQHRYVEILIKEYYVKRHGDQRD